MFQLYIPLLLSLTVGMCQGHGRLIDSPSRASAWRYGWDTPRDYQDTQSFCGGKEHQHIINGGKCGICGDPWDTPHPRPHEAGGLYATGTIVRNYTQGQVITVQVQFTANHKGHFEFRICPNDNPAAEASEACLDGNLLCLTNGGSQFNILPQTTGIFTVQLQLPQALTCSQCVFQWRYIAGNNRGICANGTGATGCGPQEEFRACADVAICPHGSGICSTTPTKVTPTRKTTRRPAIITTTAKPQTQPPPPKTTSTPETIPTIKPTSCHAVGIWQTLPGYDEWCVFNCLTVPPFCPESHCICD